MWVSHQFNLYLFHSTVLLLCLLTFISFCWILSKFTSSLLRNSEDRWSENAINWVDDNTLCYLKCNKAFTPSVTLNILRVRAREEGIVVIWAFGTLRCFAVNTRLNINIQKKSVDIVDVKLPNWWVFASSMLL